MQKNVSGQKIGVQMVSASDGSAFTGSVTVYVTGDAGTQSVGSVGSGACTHEGNGYHTYAPAQAETNYDLIAFTFVGTGAVPVTLQVYTRIDANVIQISGDTAAADNLEAAADGTGYNLGAGAIVPSATGIRSAVGLASANLDTQLSAIVTDTNELQQDWVNGGRLDLLLDQAAADATLARQIVGNKHTVVESPEGTFTIEVRNDDDSATVRTIVYVSATGARTVS